MARGAPKRSAVHPEDSSDGEGAKAAKKGKKAGGRSAGASAADVTTVANYLTQQNRPYSLIDIFNNLHGAVGKTALQKVLDQLAEDQVIVAKAFGKQTVYVVRQSTAAAPSQAELDEMDATIAQLKDKITQAKEQYRAGAARAAELQGRLTVPELGERIAKLQQENAQLAAKIQELSSGARKVDPEEKKKVDAAYSRYSKLMRERKQRCMEALNMITEGMAIRPRDLMHEIGMEE